MIIAAGLPRAVAGVLYAARAGGGEGVPAARDAHADGALAESVIFHLFFLLIS